MNKSYPYLIVIGLIVISFTGYSRILDNDFINLDDRTYITGNQNVQSGINRETITWAFSAFISGHWHPLTLLSHALDWSLFKDNAGGHHLINLLLHIGNALLVFLFLYKTTANLWPSAFVAAFFSLHPLRVESVAWAAERKDVLSMFFGLSTLVSYAFYVEKPRVSKYLLCLALFALSLMAKAMLVTLPLVLVLLDFWPLERWQKALKPINLPTTGNSFHSIKKKSIQKKLGDKKASFGIKPFKESISYLIGEKVPFLFLAMAVGILAIQVQTWVRDVPSASLLHATLAKRIMNATLAYSFYLWKTFWPFDLSVIYPYQTFSLWQFSGALFLLCGVTAVTIIFVRKMPFLIVGWLWYLGTLVPVIGLVRGGGVFADRYMYVPSIGIGIIVAWCIPCLLATERLRKIILFPASGIIFTILTILTWQQCGYWKNSIELFNHALQVTKNNSRAHNYLGSALTDENNYQEANVHYRASLKINPHDQRAHFNFAKTLMRQGNFEEAISHYREAIRIKPTSLAHNNLGLTLLKQNKLDDAIYHYRQALTLDPDNPVFHVNLGAALVAIGELKEAIEHLQTAVSLNPSNEKASQLLNLVMEMEKRHR